MVTAVDTSVLIDVLVRDPHFGEVSKTALRKASSEGSLVICETVLAEVTPALRKDDVLTFLSDWNLTFVPSSQESSILAGNMYRLFLQRGGKDQRVIADFIIGAHAQFQSQRLLARDRGYYRDYFKSLKLWDPSPSKV
jgi:predicted nucleic acid-binding protein